MIHFYLEMKWPQETRDTHQRATVCHLYKLMSSHQMPALKPFTNTVHSHYLQGLCSLGLELANTRGTWVAQLVKHPTSAQVMICQFMGLSPTLGSVLTVQSLLGILTLSLCLSLSLPPFSLKINKQT